MNRLFFIMITGLILFVSCNKKEEATNMIGDVYVFSRVSGQDTLYGLYMHAYSFSAFSSVTVTASEAPDQSYHLEAYPNTKTDFYFNTPDNILSKEKPATGNYHFAGIYEGGESTETDDILFSDVIFPPIVEKSEFDSSISEGIVQWENVVGADYYIVELFSDNKLVFYSTKIATSIKKIQFGKTDPYWNKDYEPTSGTNYKVRISAFKYEQSGNAFNMQASASTETQLLWNGN